MPSLNLTAMADRSNKTLELGVTSFESDGNETSGAHRHYVNNFSILVAVSR